MARALSYTAMIGCAALGVGVLFSEARAIELGARRLDYHQLRAPLALLGMLMLIHVLALRRDLLAWASRILRGVADERDEPLARLALYIALLAGFLLRIARIGEYGLSPDESWFVWLGASESLGDLWAYERAQSPHPPGNFILLHGLTRVGWDLAWLRLPSVLAGSLLIGVGYRLARNLFGLAAGLGMAGLIAFAPALVELSRVCRNYAPAFLLTAAAVLYFERFLRDGRWRSLLISCLLAPLAVAFHYLVVVVFIANGLVLVAQLAWHRRPLGWWVRAGLCQLPLAVVSGFLYWTHLRNLPAQVERIHREWYLDLLIRSPLEIFEPLVGVWDYLLWGRGAWLFSAITLAGCFSLVINGRRRQLAVCLVPIAVAYGLAAVGLLPVGDTRHSSYLFLFLFLLVASQIEELATGYRTTRARLRQIAQRGLDASTGGDADARRLWWPGLAAVGLVALLFVQHSLSVYAEEVSYREPLRNGRPVRELLTYYPQADIDAAFAYLDEQAGENDAVILGLQGLLLVRTHFRLSPILQPSPEQSAARDIRIALSHSEPLTLRAGGVRYLYSPRTGARLDPLNIIEALDHARQRFGLSEPEKLWILRGGWDYPMSDIFARTMPRVGFDQEAERRTHGMLFGIDTATLRPASERFQNLMRRVREEQAAGTRGDAVREE